MVYSIAVAIGDWVILEVRYCRFVYKANASDDSACPVPAPRRGVSSAIAPALTLVPEKKRSKSGERPLPKL